MNTVIMDDFQTIGLDIWFLCGVLVLIIALLLWDYSQ